MLEELRYLCSFTRTCVPNDDCYWVFLDEVEQAIVMLGDG